VFQPIDPGIRVNSRLHEPIHGEGHSRNHPPA